MKRIYLLAVALIAITSTTFAQTTRVVDLVMESVLAEEASGSFSAMMNGDTIFVNSGAGAPFEKKYSWYHSFRLTSTSPDTLLPSDVILFRTPVTGGGFPAGTLTTVGGVGYNDTVGLYYPFPDGGQQNGPQYESFTSSQTGSSITTVQWCDTSFAGTDTSARSTPSKVISDPDVSNNSTCWSIVRVYWDITNSVAGVNVEENKILLFPNPATNRLDLKYNFTESANDVTITVMSATGQVELREQFSGNYSGTETFPLNISKLPAGVHVINMTAGNGVAVTRQFNVIR